MHLGICSTWGNALVGRSAQYMHARRDGYDPWELDVCFVDRGDLVYRIELRAYPGSSQ